MNPFELTNSQARLLEMLELENYDGWMELYLAWGDYDGMSDSESFRTTKMVVASILRSLTRKGLAALNGDGCPVRTEAGEKWIQDRSRQWADETLATVR